ncbi:hypothetical protein HMPREF3226_00470 [Prevotella corporis]|uniref:Uncharacterized protein n=1 Tax=Prevotella corporis TaxID=28128 RepID=A0A133QK29_9BACT|nr:hypothetical protein HMPREF3226_00470 [Prevotella corporis]
MFDVIIARQRPTNHNSSTIEAVSDYSSNAANIGTILVICKFFDNYLLKNNN